MDLLCVERDFIPWNLYAGVLLFSCIGYDQNRVKLGEFMGGVMSPNLSEAKW